MVKLKSEIKTKNSIVHRPAAIQLRELRTESGDSRLFQQILPAVFLFASISLASAQAPSAPGKPLPPGPMQPKIKAACTQCHNSSRITEQHLTRQQWSEELEKMAGLGAVISDRNAFLNYLTKNFGPEKGAAKTAAK
jgi:hypothetical protein